MVRVVLSPTVGASGAGRRVHVPRAPEREQDVHRVLSERATLQLHHAEDLSGTNRPLRQTARREDRRPHDDDLQAGERIGQTGFLLRGRRRAKGT